MNKGIIGAVVLVVVAVAGSLLWKNKEEIPGVAQEVKQERVTPKIWATAETYKFCQQPEVRKLWHDKYRFDPVCEERTTGEILKAKAPADVAVILPASEVVAAQYIDQYKPTVMSRAVVAQSPLIAFMDKPIADALIAANIASRQTDGSTVIDLEKFIGLMRSGKKWSDVGVSSGVAYGKIKAVTTDLEKSASGQGYINAVATIYNNGEPVTEDNAAQVGGSIKPLMDALGQLPPNTKELLDNCVRTSCAQVHIGLENSFIRYAIENPADLPKIQNGLTVMYLRPGVFSSHTAVAFTESGKRFIEAMQDPQVRTLMWKLGGFRTGSQAISPKEVPVPGLSASIGTPIQMPRPPAFKLLINAALGKQ